MSTTCGRALRNKNRRSNTLAFLTDPHKARVKGGVQTESRSPLPYVPRQRIHITMAGAPKTVWLSKRLRLNHWTVIYKTVISL